MIRKSTPSGCDPMGVQRFSEKIMLNQKPQICVPEEALYASDDPILKKNSA
jgi:hypothetical protein